MIIVQNPLNVIYCVRARFLHSSTCRCILAQCAMQCSKKGATRGWARHTVGIMRIGRVSCNLTGASVEWTPSVPVQSLRRHAPVFSTTKRTARPFSTVGTPFYNLCITWQRNASR